MEDQEWPMSEIRETFDWSLSMKEIEAKYGSGIPARKMKRKGENEFYSAKLLQAKAEANNTPKPTAKNPSIRQINKAVKRIMNPTPGRIQTASEFLAERQRLIDLQKVWEGEPEVNFHEPE